MWCGIAEVMEAEGATRELQSVCGVGRVEADGVDRWPGWSGSGLGLHMGWAEFDYGLVGRNLVFAGFSGFGVHNPINRC